MVRKLRASRGDAVAYDLGRIYAQWGDSEESLKWLNAAMRIHSLWLEWLKTGPGPRSAAQGAALPGD
jgi:hypothetical protein